MKDSFERLHTHNSKNSSRISRQPTDFSSTGNKTSHIASDNQGTSTPNTPLSRYIAEISRHKLLKAEDEVRLGQEIEASNYGRWKAILQFPPAVAAIHQTVKEIINKSIAADKVYESKALSDRTDLAETSYEQIACETDQILNKLIKQYPALPENFIQSCEVGKLCGCLFTIKPELRNQWEILLEESHDEATRYRRYASTTLEKNLSLSLFSANSSSET